LSSTITSRTPQYEYRDGFLCSFGKATEKLFYQSIPSTSIQKQNLGRPNFTGQAAIEKIYAPYEATLCSAHFHTLSKPLPSPVKNRPSGPTWIVLTTCFENILPLSLNLESRKDRYRYHIGCQRYRIFIDWKRQMKHTYDGSSYRRTDLSLQEHNRTGLVAASFTPQRTRAPCNKAIKNPC
jgi:hypothetical protein